jgi:mannose-6-phosphate isomerase
VRPIELGPNQLERFYRGGPRIAAFRGLPDVGDRGPEDWVGSTTAAFGERELGRSRLPDGRLLADAVAAEPEPFLGPERGRDVRVLVKLLDAGDRLVVHLHPDDEFARAHLGAATGKSEAWLMLETAADAAVHVGFARDVGEDELAELVEAQDAEALLGALNRLPVAAGDSIFVPAGLPHAIGEGILLLELQQPADLSLLLEWQGIVPEREALLGLPRSLVLSAVRRTQLTPAELELLKSRRGETLFPAEADRFFRADLVAGGSALEPGFSILVVLDGEGELRPEDGKALPLRRGSTVLVPYGAGACELAGSCRAVRCRPPAA